MLSLLQQNDIIQQFTSNFFVERLFSTSSVVNFFKTDLLFGVVAYPVPLHLSTWFT